MLVALVSFVTGEGRLVKVGEFVADDDPVVTEREHLFGVAAPSPGGVEQATRAPGEKRPRSRRV
jgi:hypothetical protein